MVSPIQLSHSVVTKPAQEAPASPPPPVPPVVPRDRPGIAPATRPAPPVPAVAPWSPGPVEEPRAIPPAVRMNPHWEALANCAQVAPVNRTAVLKAVHGLMETTATLRDQTADMTSAPRGVAARARRTFVSVWTLAMFKALRKLVGTPLTDPDVVRVDVLGVLAVGVRADLARPLVHDAVEAFYAVPVWSEIPTALGKLPEARLALRAAVEELVKRGRQILVAGRGGISGAVPGPGYGEAWEDLRARVAALEALMRLLDAPATDWAEVRQQGVAVLAGAHRADLLRLLVAEFPWVLTAWDYGDERRFTEAVLSSPRPVALETRRALAEAAQAGQQCSRDVLAPWVEASEPSPLVLDAMLATVLTAPEACAKHARRWRGHVQGSSRAVLLGADPVAAALAGWEVRHLLRARHRAVSRLCDPSLARADAFGILLRTLAEMGDSSRLERILHRGEGRPPGMPEPVWARHLCDALHAPCVGGDVTVHAALAAPPELLADVLDVVLRAAPAPAYANIAGEWGDHPLHRATRLADGGADGLAVLLAHGADPRILSGAGFRADAFLTLPVPADAVQRPHIDLGDGSRRQTSAVQARAGVIEGLPVRSLACERARSLLAETRIRRPKLAPRDYAHPGYAPALREHLVHAAAGMRAAFSTCVLPRPNCDADALEYGGADLEAWRQGRLLRNALSANLPAGSEPELRAFAEAAERTRIGDCFSMSAVAFATMRDRSQAIRVELVVLGARGTAHRCLVVGRARGGSRADPRTWGPHAVICDPFLRVVYPAREWPRRAGLVYGGQPVRVLGANGR